MATYRVETTDTNTFIIEADYPDEARDLALGYIVDSPCDAPEWVDGGLIVDVTEVTE